MEDSCICCKTRKTRKIHLPHFGSEFSFQANFGGERDPWVLKNGEFLLHGINNSIDSAHKNNVYSKDKLHNNN